MKRFLTILVMVCLLVAAMVTISTIALADDPCAQGHKYDSWKWDSSGPLVCGETYSQYRTCTRPGCNHSEDREAVYQHSWRSWKTTTEPTCTEDGRQTRTCKNCGKKQYKAIDALGHDWSEWYVVYPPVGPTSGLEERVCQRCGLTEQREIPGNGDPLPPPEDRNPSFYLEFVSATQPNVVGDTVSSVWKLTNTGNVEACFSAYAFKDANGNMVDCTYALSDEGTGSDNCISAGEYLLIDIDFVVNDDDAAAGKVDRTLQEFGYLAYAPGTPSDGTVYNNDDPVSTNIASLELPLGKMHLEVSKTVLVPPEDPKGFKANETIHYLITVTNPTPVTLYSTLVYDILYGSSNPMVDLGTLAPGQSASVGFDYTVNDWFAAVGQVINSVTVCGYYQPDKTVIGFDKIYCETQDAQPKTSAVLVKTEVSVPADGYYRANDVIQYTITLTNTGDVAFDSFYFYDSQASGMIDLGYDLQPGQSTTIPFSYTVTEADVGGYVYNTAYAKIYIGREIINVTSNTVKSPTDKDPDDHDGFDLPESSEESCVRTLINCGEGYTYELHFCGTHARTQEDVRVLIPAGASPEVEAAAWNYATTFWKDAVDALYADLSAAALGMTRSAVMEEQIAFTVMTENLAETLKQLDPSHPEKVAYLIARLWENKCVDLCWLLHHGSEPRPDHLTNAKAACASSRAACDISVVESAGNRELYADSLCAAHCSTDAVCKSMLLQNDSDAAWRMSASIWQREASKLSEKAWRTAAASDRGVILTTASTFDAWLNSQRALYATVYDTATIEEISTRSAMEFVMTLCGVIE